MKPRLLVIFAVVVPLMIFLAQLIVGPLELPAWPKFLLIALVLVIIYLITKRALEPPR